MPNLKIFAVLGAMLCLSGVAQVFFRPRRDKESAGQRVINRSTVQMILFLIVGILGVLVGVGVIPVRIGR